MPDKKLTDNEIKKALECCVNNTNEDCNKCVCSGSNVSCVDVLLTNALDLINRLQAENERLTIRLRKAEHQLDDLCIMHNVIKAEAYKEFAERLEKMMCYEHFFETDVVVLDRNKLNNLLKELVGDNK